MNPAMVGIDICERPNPICALQHILISTLEDILFLLNHTCCVWLWKGGERYCRNNTHKLKIFSHHESVSLSVLSDYSSPSLLFLLGPSVPWVKSYVYEKINALWHHYQHSAAMQTWSLYGILSYQTILVSIFLCRNLSYVVATTAMEWLYVRLGREEVERGQETGKKWRSMKAKS